MACQYGDAEGGLEEAARWYAPCPTHYALLRTTHRAARTSYVSTFSTESSTHSYPLVHFSLATRNIYRFRGAAEAGVAASQYELGVALVNGDGVAVDRRAYY